MSVIIKLNTYFPGALSNIFSVVCHATMTLILLIATVLMVRSWTLASKHLHLSLSCCQLHHNIDNNPFLQNHNGTFYSILFKQITM